MKTIYYYKTFFSILFIYTFIFTGCSSQSIEEKQINVVFRFDDPSALSSTEIELKVIDAFREHNASLTFGVIPFKCAGSTRDTSPQDVVPLGSKKGELLRKAVEEGIVDIALHGYSHQMREAEIWTEFSGMDYDNQLDKLSKGKKFLEEMIGVPIVTFIPPYNTYDLNTLKALQALKFTTLSAGIHGEVSDESHLNFIPITIRLHQLQTAAKQARESLDRHPLIVIMFHEYDFLDVNVSGINKKIITFEVLDTLLRWINSQKDIQMITLEQASKEISDVTRKRFEYVKRYTSHKPIIPGFLRKSNSVYPEVSSLLKTALKTASLYLVIMLLGILISYMIGYRIMLEYMKNMHMILVASSIIIIMPIIYVMIDLQIQARELAVYLFLVGISIGLWICFWKIKKK